MLGQPGLYFSARGDGVHLSGELPEGATATDLTPADHRNCSAPEKVVGQVRSSSTARALPRLEPQRTRCVDREHGAGNNGATMALPGWRSARLDILRLTGPRRAQIGAPSGITTKPRASSAFRRKGEIEYTKSIDLELRGISLPCVAARKRPPDRIAVPRPEHAFRI